MLLLAAAKLRHIFLICKILGVFFFLPAQYFTKSQTSIWLSPALGLNHHHKSAARQTAYADIPVRTWNIFFLDAETPVIVSVADQHGSQAVSTRTAGLQASPCR